MPYSAPAEQPRSLRALTSSGDYFARVSDIVRGIGTVGDPLRAVELLEEATRRMGAEVSIFASLVPEDDTRSSYRLLLACDPAWGIRYEQEGLYASDPWLAYAMHHSEPVLGTHINATAPAHRSTVELAAQFGFRSTVIVPAPSRVGLSRIGVLCLGSSVAGYFEDEGYVALKVVARSVAMELHEWWIARLRDELMASAHVSEGDLMLLGHEHQGHSTKAIARALGVSTESINSRFQRLNARLGVPNRKVAARLAAEYGLI